MFDPRHFCCPKCTRVNRVGAEHLGRKLRCGECGHVFSATTEVLELDSEGLERLIAVAPVPLLVDFWATWCGPCQAFSPQLESFARSQAGRALVAKVDVDDNPLAVQKYKVQSVPTVGLWNTAQLRYLQAGALSPVQLDRLVAPHRQYVV